MHIDARIGLNQVSTLYHYEFVGEDELRLSPASAFTKADVFSNFEKQEVTARPILTLKRETNRNRGN